VQAAGFLSADFLERLVTMKFEMTKCNQCGSDMLMGATVCPSCGKAQTGYGKPGGLYTPGTMLAVGLAAAVLLVFNWIKSPAPQVSQVTSPPSVTLPAR
jgi:hypothetical protein